MKLVEAEGVKENCKEKVKGKGYVNWVQVMIKIKNWIYAVWSKVISDNELIMVAIANWSYGG